MNLFYSPTSETYPQRALIEKIFDAALRAADPKEAMRAALSVEGDRLIFHETPFLMERGSRLAILAVGKAAPSMAAAALEILGDRVTEGLVIAKHPPTRALSPLRVLVGGHPLPNEASLHAGRAALHLARGLEKNDILLLLLSGGGSALMTAPETLSLKKLRKLTQALLASGATIEEINTLRRHLDSVKGGGLAEAAYPARVLALVLSDVIGSPLEAIASGPAAPDPSTLEDARRICKKYSLPTFATRALQRVQETPKPDAAIFENVQHFILCDNATSLRAMKKAAEDAGIRTILLTTRLQGEAAHVGRALGALLRQPLPRPICLLAGGETTVTLGKRNGFGGRNQELALGAVRALAGIPNAALFALASDGEDGETDAAGAFVTGETLRRAREKGLLPEGFLQRHDSYTFFDTLGNLLRIGSTGTNVNDWVIGIRG